MLSPAPPPLRPLESRVALRAAGREGLVLVRDPLGIALDHHGATGTLAIAPDAWRLARSFDGRRTPEEIARELSLDAALVRQAAEAFSRRLLLDDARAGAALRAARATFERASNRPLAPEGEGRAGEGLELRIRLAGLVADDWDMPAPAELHGLVAPAGPTDVFAPLYSRAYAALRHVHGAFARALVLAEGSPALTRVLVPLAKPFATPWGDQPCDVRAVSALGCDGGDEVLAHREAVTLERQVLFLRLIAPGLPIVPLLVGAARIGDLESAQAALERVLALPGRTLVLAAVDLGPSWTEAAAGGASARREVDRREVEPLLALDAPAFEARAGDSSARLAPRHAALALAVRLLALRRAAAGGDALQPLAGEVMGYVQKNVDGRLASAVAIAFHRRRLDSQGATSPGAASNGE